LITQKEIDAAYIQALQTILAANGIEIPPVPEVTHYDSVPRLLIDSEHVMQDGSFESLDKTISKLKQYMNILPIDVQYHDLSFWGMVSKTRIPTVGSTLRDLLLFGTGPKLRVDVLKNLTGRIASQKMTLVMGPPGCGKSSFLKALSGQLHLGNNKLEGSITYNGDTTSSGKFKLPKIADYIDEKDQHAATLLVLPSLVLWS
jgi:ABC-type multidrug transport system ATPase subunit